MRRIRLKKIVEIICFLILVFMFLRENGYIGGSVQEDPVPETAYVVTDLSYRGIGIPDYSGSPYYIINNNEPWFDEDDMTMAPFEEYSDLDHLGRCGVAYANICTDLMPTEARDEIGSIKPSGWNNKNYGELVDGNYLYNRCHLIGFQLAGENANAKNLITGTRYLNVQGMLPFENLVADYVKETDEHVLYRVTPVYIGDELVCRGVVMEAMSVETKGEDVKFCVFVYNVQPGISINYTDGSSHLAQ